MNPLIEAVTPTSHRSAATRCLMLMTTACLLLAGCSSAPPVVPPKPEPHEPKACFPGPGQRTCLPILTRTPPEAFTYPQSTDFRYAIPSVWLDLARIGPDVALSEHFTLGELTDKGRGQYASLLPFAIDKLQQVRNTVGPIRVTSGYRNPAHNRDVGGAPLSRHQYGDGFDLVPLEASQNDLQKACNNAGATFTMTYEDGHVHCDWRDGGTRSLDGLDLSTMVASLTRGPDGSLTVEAEGFDEGAPTMTWRALDADGEEVSKRESIKWRSRGAAAKPLEKADVGSTAKSVDKPLKTRSLPSLDVPGETPNGSVLVPAFEATPPKVRKAMAFRPPANYAVVELNIGGVMTVVRPLAEIEDAPAPKENPSLLDADEKAPAAETPGKSGDRKKDEKRDNTSSAPGEPEPTVAPTW